MPNLLATRTTYNFDDSPKALKNGGWPKSEGLHFVGESGVEVSVRNEQEKLGVGDKAAKLRAGGGLVTWGEFGALLLQVLSDASNGSIQWSHWESSPTGRVSVFDYVVPKALHITRLLLLWRKPEVSGSSRWLVADNGLVRTEESRWRMANLAEQARLSRINLGRSPDRNR